MGKSLRYSRKWTSIWGGSETHKNGQRYKNSISFSDPACRNLTVARKWTRYLPPTQWLEKNSRLLKFRKWWYLCQNTGCRARTSMPLLIGNHFSVVAMTIFGMPILDSSERGNRIVHFIWVWDQWRVFTEHLVHNGTEKHQYLDHWTPSRTMSSGLRRPLDSKRCSPLDSVQTYVL